MSLQSTDGQAWYREPWPWILMSGPAVVIVAGVVTAWMAISGRDALVEDDYYKQGLNVNKVIERDRQAVQMGLQAEFMLAGNQIRVLLSGGSKEVLPPSLILKLMHPTLAGTDQVVGLVAEGPGMYGGRLKQEISGRWKVTLEDNTGRWRLHGDWMTHQNNTLHLTAGGDAGDHSTR